MKIEKLQALVYLWAQEKGLLTDVTPLMIEKQTLKVLEEVGETAGAYLKGNREELIDGIGDVAVTIIILAAMNNGAVVPNPFPSKQNDLISVAAEVSQCRVLGYSGLIFAFNTLDNFAKNQFLDLSECLEVAYNVISKRTGNMVNGAFIKN